MEFNLINSTGLVFMLSTLASAALAIQLIACYTYMAANGEVSVSGQQLVGQYADAFVAMSIIMLVATVIGFYLFVRRIRVEGRGYSLSDEIGVLFPLLMSATAGSLNLGLVYAFTNVETVNANLPNLSGSYAWATLSFAALSAFGLAVPLLQDSYGFSAIFLMNTAGKVVDAMAGATSGAMAGLAAVPRTI